MSEFGLGVRRRGRERTATHSNKCRRVANGAIYGQHETGEELAASARRQAQALRRSWMKRGAEHAELPYLLKHDACTNQGHIPRSSRFDREENRGVPEAWDAGRIRAPASSQCTSVPKSTQGRTSSWFRPDVHRGTTSRCWADCGAAGRCTRVSELSSWHAIPSTMVFRCADHTHEETAECINCGRSNGITKKIADDELRTLIERAYRGGHAESTEARGHAQAWGKNTDPTRTTFSPDSWRDESTATCAGLMTKSVGG